MNDKPMLPRGVLTGEAMRGPSRVIVDPATGLRLRFHDNASLRAAPAFPIDWQAVEIAARVAVNLSELDRAAIEATALRYRLELDRERASDGISFGKMRGHAGKIAAAAEKLRGLLADPAAPSLLSADPEALQRLQDEAANLANSNTGARGSPAYSYDLRESLLRVIAGRWLDAGANVSCAAFYRAGAEVLRQANPDNMTDDPSLEKAVQRFVEKSKPLNTGET